ncbi:uncharacterized protein LTR77_002624 [Saxophila tyrrhenica]|uniref:G domain-containing protein n=1 Tax=Saxophila tyrrhenica TaxID=1690608 RepID=A0AAV9PHY1_9PEZI|nr:hypothetical protein LTR77_002624 [Saxophila tyrrhenica]
MAQPRLASQSNGAGSSTSNDASGQAPTPSDIVIAVMGVTGCSKTTFIQHFCLQNLNVGHDLNSCTSKVEIVPCFMPDGRKIFLVDTPGFNDSHLRSDTDILREIADWLALGYEFKIKLAGIIYLHRITDTRISGSGMRNLRMFRNLCGTGDLGSVVLATTMWESCPTGIGGQRMHQLQSQDDLWGHLISQGARVFKQDQGRVSAQRIIDYLMERATPVTLDIQREMVDQGLDLDETSAGQEVKENLEKDKENHHQQLSETREGWEVAVREKDQAQQMELRDRYNEIRGLYLQLQKQSSQLELLSWEKLRAEMKEQHSRDTEELKNELKQRHRRLERTSDRNLQSTRELWRTEVAAWKAKMSRMEMWEAYRYKYRFVCDDCDQAIVTNTRPRSSKQWCSSCDEYTIFRWGGCRKI